MKIQKIRKKGGKLGLTFSLVSTFGSTYSTPWGPICCQSGSRLLGPCPPTSNPWFVHHHHLLMVTGEVRHPSTHTGEATQSVRQVQVGDLAEGLTTADQYL